jgi:hypothetical protein
MQAMTGHYKVVIVAAHLEDRRRNSQTSARSRAQSVGGDAWYGPYLRDTTATRRAR